MGANANWERVERQDVVERVDVATATHCIDCGHKIGFASHRLDAKRCGVCTEKRDPGRVRRYLAGDRADASSYDRGLAASMLRELRAAGVVVDRPDDPHFVQGVHKAWSERRGDSNHATVSRSDGGDQMTRMYGDPLMDGLFDPAASASPNRRDGRPYPYSQVSASGPLPGESNAPMPRERERQAQTPREFQGEAEEEGSVDAAIDAHARARASAWKVGRNAGKLAEEHADPGISDPGGQEPPDDDDIAADAYRDLESQKAEAWKTGRNGGRR